MKKILISVLVCVFLALSAPIAKADGSDAALILDVAKGIFNLAKIIKGANTNPDLVLGKELEAYKINSKYTVVLSDGSYKNSPCFLFSAYDNKTKMIYYTGYEKNSTKDMQEINDFNKMNTFEKKNFIKNEFMKYAKYDLGEVETEPVVSTEPAPAKSEKTETSSIPTPLTPADKTLVKSFPVTKSP